MPASPVPLRPANACVAVEERALQRRVVPFKIGAGFSLWGRTPAVDGLFPPTAPCPYSSHPLRRSGRTYFCATSEFTLKLERSQVSFCPMRDATFPSSKVSVTSPSNSKFPPGFTFPPLHASSHSRSLPGDLLQGRLNARQKRKPIVGNHFPTRARRPQ